MRLLLAALTCEKGAVEANLARHIEVLEEARRAGADLVVFPEMSLTGSVDPVVHPERAIPLDHPAVGRLVAAAQRHQTSAVFGIGEVAPDGFWITQVAVDNGRVQGVQRKRHLGVDEAGFETAGDTTVFELGIARFGAIICAESGVDRTWDANAAAGAALHLLCAAPGLTGRRTDAAGWRAGLEWWEGAGLADAQHQARRLQAWVAVATQAGATVDEDFPGLAALVAPSGEVVARLPDERPGTLVVEVPVPHELPIRQAVRVLVVDDAGRTLLAQYGEERSAARWWVPPGGGQEPGEDDQATARRELFEELGRTDLVVGEPLGRRRGTFRTQDRWFTQHERWYLCRCRPFEVDPEVVAAVRAEGIRAIRWWSSTELRDGDLLTAPRDLPALLDAIAAGRLPDPHGDLGR